MHKDGVSLTQALGRRLNTSRDSKPIHAVNIYEGPVIQYHWPFLLSRRDYFIVILVHIN